MLPLHINFCLIHTYIIIKTIVDLHLNSALLMLNNCYYENKTINLLTTTVINNLTIKYLS